MRGETVTYKDVKRVKASEKAMLVEFPTGLRDWVPFSQVHDDSEVYAEGDGEGCLIVSVWIADQKGWDLEKGPLTGVKPPKALSAQEELALNKKGKGKRYAEEDDEVREAAAALARKAEVEKKRIEEAAALLEKVKEEAEW